METGLAARAFFNGSEKAVGGEVREGSAVEDQCEKRAVSKADGATCTTGWPWLNSPGARMPT
jgi:hypothetical protein